MSNYFDHLLSLFDTNIRLNHLRQHLVYLYKYFYKCSAAADMGDCLATIDMGRKLGGCVTFERGSWVPM